MRNDPPYGPAYRFWRLGIAPALVYLVLFVVLTWPLILQFQTHYFADSNDGMTNAWNLWWVREALTRLHTSPWHTPFLNHPAGVALHGHTLNAFNGIVSIPLCPLLGPVGAHNTIVVLFAFVGSGLAAFWLALYLVRSFWPALLAGAIFTFSQYHFAHAQGHLNLISMEWIPVFLLLWSALLRFPTPTRALGAAFALLAVYLCSKYYFLFCVMAAAILFTGHAFRPGPILFFVRKRYLKAWAFFVPACLLTSGPLIAAFIRADRIDPLTGAHNPANVSLDLLDLFIPGGHWRFHPLTRAYWSRLPVNIHETSVAIGFTLAIVLLVAWFQRRRMQRHFPAFTAWWGVFLFFWIMSLGPTLRVAAVPVLRDVMPYRLLEYGLPFLQKGGTPARMISMSILATAILCAMAARVLLHRASLARWAVAGALIGSAAIEHLPRPMPATRIAPPSYIRTLAAQPAGGGVLDTVHKPGIKLLLQTRHRVPIALGTYIARCPSTTVRDFLAKHAMAELKQYGRLRAIYDIRYLIARDPKRKGPNWELVKLDDTGETGLYRIEISQHAPRGVDLPDTTETKVRGHIDRFRYGWIQGWAVLPETNARNTQIGILLRSDNATWRIDVQRIARPDVSEYLERPGLYDAAGFEAVAGLWDLPPGKYRVGIAVRNASTYGVMWTDHFYEPNGASQSSQ